MDLEVAYSPGHGPDKWEPQYREGNVPGTWLYGLHRLGRGSGVAASASEVSPLSIMGKSKVASLVLYNWFARRRTSSKPAESSWLVLWDELAATRAVAQRTVDRAVCGAIWCTDEIRRSPSSLRNKITREVLRGMDGIWCLSQPQVEELKVWLGPSAPPIRYIPFGIDTEFFTKSPYPNDGAPLVVSLGSDRDRDYRTLVAALEKIRTVVPNARCLMQCAPNIQVPTGIGKLPRLSHREIRDLYRQSTVVLVPTRMNGHFSGMTVALEAMSTGRPVIVSDTPGARSYVRHGLDGYLCRPGDSDAFADRVIQILHDPSLGREMGASASDSVSTQFNHRTLAHAIDEFVQDLAISMRE
jgi:glycosyltransferase involved in cell wall biosynthesis